MDQSLFHETKDKDEVRIKGAIAWIKGLTDEQKIQIARETLDSVNDIVVRLWRLAWGIGHWQNMSPYQRADTERLIKNYGYDNVRKAFQTAAEKDVKNLAYVNGVLKHEAEMEASRREVEQAKQIDSTPISDEARKTTAEVIKKLRMELGEKKENKYLAKQPLSKAEYIKEFNCGDSFSEAEYRAYKNNFKGV